MIWGNVIIWGNVLARNFALNNTDLLSIEHLVLRKKLQWTHNQHKEIAFENGLCKMIVTLFRPNYVIQ